jgi:hypothetical protein
MVRRLDRRDEARRPVTWSSAGQLRVVSVLIVVGPDTRRVTAAVPGNFGPLEQHASKECRTMVSIMATSELSRRLNATAATDEVIWLVIVRRQLREMLQRDRDIGVGKDAQVSRNGNKRNNGLL